MVVLSTSIVRNAVRPGFTPAISPEEASIRVLRGISAVAHGGRDSSACTTYRPHRLSAVHSRLALALSGYMEFSVFCFLSQEIFSTISK